MVNKKPVVSLDKFGESLEGQESRQLTDMDWDKKKRIWIIYVIGFMVFLILTITASA